MFASKSTAFQFYFYLLTSLLLLLSQPAYSTVTINAPIIVECSDNGLKCNLRVSFKPALKNGQIVKYYTDDKKTLILSVKPNGFGLKAFGINLRKLKESRGFHVVVESSSGKETASAFIKSFTGRAKVPRTSTSTKASVKEIRARKTRALIALTAEMSRQSHIKHAKIKTESGTADIRMTPYVDDNPSFYIKSDKNLGTIKVAVQMGAVKKPKRNKKIVKNNTFQQADKLLDANEFKKAIALFKKAIKQGSPLAKAGLAWMHHKGFGVEKNSYAAKSLVYDNYKQIKALADNGDKAAQFYTGVLYTEGWGFDRDRSEGFWYFLQSAKQGYFKAMFAAGKGFVKGKAVQKDLNKGYAWHEKAAKAGYARSMVNYGFRYYTGNGVQQNDPLAFDWFLKAAKLGGPTAMYNLGTMYDEARGVTEDKAKARYWFAKSADKNNFSLALDYLGDYSRDGIGGPQDYRKAVKYYERAVTQGNKYSTHSLAELYRDGKGVQKNLEMAKAYFGLAGGRGHEDAEKIYKQMGGDDTFKVTGNQLVLDKEHSKCRRGRCELSISIKPSLSSGQTVKTYINGHLAASLTPSYFEVTGMNVPIKATQKINDVVVQITENGKALDTICTRLSSVDRQKSIPAHTDNKQSVSNTGHRNVVELRVYSEMPLKNHINNISIKTKSGLLDLQTTPYYAGYSIYSIYANEFIGYGRDTTISTRKGNYVAKPVKQIGHCKQTNVARTKEDDTLRTKPIYRVGERVTYNYTSSSSSLFSRGDLCPTTKPCSRSDQLSSIQDGTNLTIRAIGEDSHTSFGVTFVHPMYKVTHRGKTGWVSQDNLKQ